MPLTEIDPAWAGWSGPIPQPEAEAAPFWDGLRRGVLVIQRCRDCHTWIHYPKASCPACHSFDLGFEPVSGRGEVYTFTSVAREFSPGVRPPYVAALVQLEDAPTVRLVTDLVGCEADQVHIGMPVRAVFQEVSAEAGLVFFTPRENGVEQ